MTFDATFWVAVSFFIFFGALIYLKVPGKVNEILANIITDIKKEIDEVVHKKILPEESALRNAPHTIYTLTSKWEYQYSKEQAVFPLPYVKANKFWPSVRRVDDAFGDRNLHCSCAPIDEYQ